MSEENVHPDINSQRTRQLSRMKFGCNFGETARVTTQNVDDRTTQAIGLKAPDGRRLLLNSV